MHTYFAPLSYCFFHTKHQSYVILRLKLYVGCRSYAMQLWIHKPLGCYLQAIVWFFGRWADTYLMPADAGRGPNSTPSSNEGDQQQLSGTAGPQHHPLVLAFGEEGGGKAVLEVLVRVGVAALTAWPGERTLQACVSALTL